VAVHAAKLVADKANPDRKGLRGSAVYFDHSVTAVVYLRSGERRSRGFLGGSADKAESDESEARNRLVLATVLENTDGGTMNLKVISELSLLGDAVAVPKLVALAPGQKVTLEPFHSSHGEVHTLEVTLTLKRDGIVETQKFSLAPLAKNEPK
jgi:hypothetical protein